MLPLRLQDSQTELGFERSECLRSRFRPHDCRRCEAACLRGAIEAEAGGVRIDTVTCDGCMLCVPACPAEALRPPGPGFLSVVEDLSEVERPVLGCRGQGETDAHARVECLGQLASEQLLALEILVPGRLTLNASTCSRCCRAGSLRQLKRRLSRTRRVDTVGQDRRLRLIESPDELGADSADCDRRSFFRSAGKRLTRRLADCLDRLQDGRAPRASKRPPQRTVLLAAALRRLSTDKRKAAEEACFPQVRLNAACDHCGRCAAVCPTNALLRSRDNGIRHLEVLRARCTACGVCESFCPQGGIEVIAPDRTVLVDSTELNVGDALIAVSGDCLGVHGVEDSRLEPAVGQDKLRRLPVEVHR